MKSKFDFYELVIVKTQKSKLSKINNLEGIIMGKSQDDETGEWGYSVSMIIDDIARDVMEEDLESTGKKVDKNYYQSGARVRVQVDPITGRGKIVDSEE